MMILVTTRTNYQRYLGTSFLSTFLLPKSFKGYVESCLKEPYSKPYNL